MQTHTNTMIVLSSEWIWTSSQAGYHQFYRCSDSFVIIIIIVDFPSWVVSLLQTSQQRTSTTIVLSLERIQSSRYRQLYSYRQRQFCRQWIRMSSVQGRISFTAVTLYLSRPSFVLVDSTAFFWSHTRLRIGFTAVSVYHSRPFFVLADGTAFLLSNTEF